MPSLSVIIPTQGRVTLPAALQSIRALHAPAEVEVIVVADTHGELLADVGAIARQHEARYLEHDAGYHGYGHPQLAAGYDVAGGRWLLALGDDDVYLPGGLDAVLAATAEADPGIFMFRITMFPSLSRRVPSAFTIWQAPALACGNVSAQCIVVPNNPARLGDYPPHSTGDYEFIRHTVELWGGPEVVAWRTEVICACY